jgi:hypothetical protein
MIPFMDVLVIRKETTMTIKVYKKPINPGLYLNLNSNHPQNQKRGLVQSLHKGASTICQEFQDLCNEISSLRHNLKLMVIPKVSLTLSLMQKIAFIRAKR